MIWYEIAFSIILEMNFKLEMGLKLEYTSWSRDFFFSLGLIMASLSCTGTLAVSIDMLIILVKTGNKTSVQSFIIDAGRGSKIQVLRRQELIKLFTWASVMRSNSVSSALQTWASTRELATGVYGANESFLITAIFWQKKSTNLFARTSEDGAVG